MCLYFTCLTPTSLWAATSIEMEVQAAYGGRFKFGEWLPLFVNLQNPGPDVTGEVRATVTSDTGQLDFSLPLELPSAARKRVTLYVLANNFSRSVKVKFITTTGMITQSEQTLATKQVKLSVLPNDRYVIGAIMANADGVAAMNPPLLTSRRERADLVGLTLAELADRHEGWRVLNALVLNDVDTSLLSPAQQVALSRWVAEGGRLVLGGGAGAARTLAGLPAELQPVTLGQLQEVLDLSGLAAYADKPIRVPGPFLLAATRPVAQATTLQTQLAGGTADNLPLIVEIPFGSGYVDFIALDLSQSPFDAWAGLTDFTKKLLSPGAAWPQNLPMDMSPQQLIDNQMGYALTNLPSLDLPSVRLLGLLLIGYVILVGPVNYWVLRWRDRLAWAWVTIPLLTLAFSGVAYGIGLGLRGSDIIINQVSVIQSGPDGQASRVNTYVGVFSPHQQAYDIDVAAKALIRPMNQNSFDPWAAQASNQGSLNLVQGEPAQVRGLAVNQWSMQSFMVETIPTAQPGLQAKLTPTQRGLEGQIINQSDESWQDVVLVFNSQFQKFGDLAPGEQAEVRLDLSDSTLATSIGSYMLYQDEFNQPTGPSRELTFKQSVLDNTVFNTSRVDLTDQPILMGWRSQSGALEVLVPGRQANMQKSTFVYGPQPLSFDQPQVFVPPGLSQLEIVSTTANSSPCYYGVGPDGFYLYQGETETKISLPKTIPLIRPEQIGLLFRTDGGWTQLPSLELFDQTSQEWIPLKKTEFGFYPIHEVDRFYDQANASVRLRASHNGAVGGGCLFIDLTLAGTRL
jgi:hypothetical protein